jgi:hypothetical protein
VDTQTDSANCGGCGAGGGGGGANACRHNEICLAGTCDDYAPVENADSSCTTCPCAFCTSILSYPSCCANAAYGDICFDGSSCP